MAATLPADGGKLGNVLGFLATDFSTRPAAAQSRSVLRNKPYALAAAQPNAGIVRTIGDTVLVKVVAASKKVAPALQTALAALGATVTAAYGPLLSAAVPVSKLAGLANLSGLLYADASYAPVSYAGTTDDLGVQAMNADKAQKQYAVDGSGVRVGILSDSYNILGGASSGVASGDLPSGGVAVIKEGPSDGADEGRAMAEIVHDVAPGSPISFYSAYFSEADFAVGINTLAKPTASGGQNAKVVVDDIGYFDEPFFQDGVVAQAVNNVYNAYGTSYFSAAGNSGRASYEGAFGPTASMNLAGSGTGVYEDFDTTVAVNPYQSITVPAGQTITLSYQWDSPYASASSAAGGTASSGNSVSIYLLDSAKTGVIASGTTNRVGGDAYQIISYTNPSSTTAATYYLTAKVRAGTSPMYAKFVDYGGGAPAFGFATNSGTSVGHQVATGGLGVGAARYDNTPAFNTSPAVKESFSSAGGTGIRFNANGTSKASVEFRQQPAITAPDGAATTFFYGQDTAFDGQYHFYGTSAAAPHAAAVAALLLQAKPTLTNADVYSALKSTASDMSTSGFDYDTGFGLVQADKAIASVAASSIGGTVYRDLNANGTKDAGDTAVSGQTVFLDSNNNGVADSSTGTATQNTATSIPDATATYNALSRATSSLTTNFGGRVTGLTVNVQATGRISDLGFTLVTPAGTRIPLFTNLGYLSAQTGTSVNVTLSDASANYIQNFASAGALSGTYKPQTTLTAANGENATGTWQLEARDYQSGGTVGSINSWSLNIAYADPTATTDSSGNYAFTALTPSAFFGTYRVRVATLSGVTLATPATAYDLTLPPSSTITGRDFGFVSNATPSTIISGVIDDGTAQRSRVRTADITISGTVTAANIAAGAFTLTQTSGTAGSPVSSWTVNVTSVTTPAAGQTKISLSFSGPALVAGSLSDGRYSLLIDGSKITDSNGTKLDAANTSVAGSTLTSTFHRFYGDVTGDAKVDISDFNIFAPAFGLSSPALGYVSSLDYNGDNAIDISDFNSFAPRFGTSV